MTHQILDVLPLDKSLRILEPACGNGAITKVLLERGFRNVTGKDIRFGSNFLEETGNWDFIITNPPFSLADEFIYKCKELVDSFLLLLPLSYLHGQKRYERIYTDEDYKLSDVYVFTRYPMLGESLRDDGFYNTGMMVYAWYYWVRGAVDTKISWLDNNGYILRK